MTLAQLHSEPQHLLLKCISGSRAYNLAVPTSDTDIKGIYVLPQQELYGLKDTPQVANETNDEVYYEIGRFIDLLLKNNPNILELLSSPASTVLFRHPLMDLISAGDFLSKLCLDTFAGYAKTQVKKARGLNKKINQTFDSQRKSLLDFCWVVEDKVTVPLTGWLAKHGLAAADCGLVNLAHFRDAYLLFHRDQLLPEGIPRGMHNELSRDASPGIHNELSREAASIRGIISGPDANDVQLSSIPPGIPPRAILHFNKDAYSLYCKDYASYWQWVDDRNDARYQNTLAHGKNYDAKNMMHTFRLLNMAGEIATQHRVVVHREDRDFLLRIRSGEFEYEALLEMVEEKMAELETLYAASDLPEAPDPAHAEALLVRIRESFYAG